MHLKLYIYALGKTVLICTYLYYDSMFLSDMFVYMFGDAD